MEHQIPQRGRRQAPLPRKIVLNSCVTDAWCLMMINARRTMMDTVREIIWMVLSIVTNGIGVETKVTVGAR